jgi:MinD-like ATPase involved in chromosome partitioning or flagellar assembly
MTLIAFASAKGSPGVTQTVMGLASVWTREAVVADLDPVGGDVGLRLGRSDGLPLDHDNGLLSYGAAVRSGQAADLTEHLQRAENGTRVLVGVAGPGQVQGLGPAWPHIGAGLRGAPTDVLADCGRLSPGSPAMPVLERASAVVMVARSEIAALAHLRERLRWMSDALRATQGDHVPTAVVLVGDASDQRSADDLARLLASSGIDVPVLGTVAYDPKTVRNLPTISERALRRSLFQRSLLDVASRVQALVAAREGTWEPEPEPQREAAV